MKRSRTIAALFSASLVLAACGGDGDTDAGGDDAAAGGGATVTLLGTDALAFEPETLSADAGEITFELTCEGGVNHNVEIDGEIIAECDPGETATGTIELEAGEYEYICSVPGHAERMRGTLTVS